MKINILGTEYEFTEDESITNENADGICKPYSRKILVRPKEKMLEEDDEPEVKEIRYREVVRHEVVHAFFAEAGIDKYYMDEELVSWLALQIPKMNEVFDLLKAGDR